MDDKPDAVIIHVGNNDILTNANHEEIARNIIKIGLNSKNHSVNDVVISSVLVKKNPNLNALIRSVNDLLRDLCSMNGFGYICNDTITTEYLWKDGIYLQDLGTNILRNTLIKKFFRDFDSKLPEGDLYKNCDEPYEKLSEIFVDILNHQAPIREKQIRGNQAPFMNKQLSLAIMEKSKTRN